MALAEDRITEDGLDDRVTEDGLDVRVTEGFVPETLTLKYEIVGTSDVKERASFKFEFPQKNFVVIE